MSFNDFSVFFNNCLGFIGCAFIVKELNIVSIKQKTVVEYLFFIFIKIILLEKKPNKR